MQNFSFEWNAEKNILNISKHGVSFSEAATAFDDKNAIYLPDDEHSEYEERFVVIGFSVNLRLLVVCHCYKESDSVIRIISARKANKTEIELYGGVK